MIKLGNVDIKNIMLGATKVKSIFLGSIKVYPNIPVPAASGVYVYHIDKKFYTFSEFKQLADNSLSQVLGYAIVDSRGAFLLPPRINTSATTRWCPLNFDTFVIPDIGIGVKDLNGEQNTQVLYDTFKNVAGSTEYAAGYAYKLTPVPIGTNWYLPSIGELLIINPYRSELQAMVFEIFGFSYFGYNGLWSSTQQDVTTAWLLNSSGEESLGAKIGFCSVLPVIKLR